MVNGKVLTIGYNLWNFLNTMRGLPGLDLDEQFWTDQICIDQRSDLRELIRLQLNNSSELSPRPWYRVPNFVRGWVVHDWTTRPPHDNLLELITTYRSFDCARPHDRVYALLGMTTTLIQAEYECPLEHLLSKLLDYAAARHHIDEINLPKMDKLSITLAGILGVHIRQEACRARIKTEVKPTIDYDVCERIKTQN